MDDNISKCPAYRIAYFALGWLCFGLGVIGAVLPVMPSTIFMIAALWAFARSSERFHNWLYTHRVFGPPLQRWQHHRVIPPYAKCLALGSMTASLIYMAFFSNAPVLAVVSAALFMTFGAVYILMKPSYVPVKQD